MLVAMGCSVAYFAICIKLMDYGFGRHIWEVTAVQMGHYAEVCENQQYMDECPANPIAHPAYYPTGSNIYMGARSDEILHPPLVSPKAAPHKQ
jgi:hypothetical protein